MPLAAKRPCPGKCGTLVESGSCGACRNKKQALRGTTAKRGYDQAHRRLRVLCFVRDSFCCGDCKWEPEIVRICREAGAPRPPVESIMAVLRMAFERGEMYLEMDHVVTIAERPDLRLSLENVATLCKACHSKKTAREDGGFGYNSSQSNASKRVITSGNALRIGAEIYQVPAVHASANPGQ